MIPDPEKKIRPSAPRINLWGLIYEALWNRYELKRSSGNRKPVADCFSGLQHRPKPLTADTEAPVRRMQKTTQKNFYGP